MMFQRKFVISILVLALLFTEACSNKKTVPPPPSPAPTIAVELPDEIPENPETPIPEVAQAPVAPQPVNAKPKKAPKASAKKTTPPASATPAAVAATPPAPAANNHTVASLRPAQPDTAIAAAIPSQKVTEQKEKTAHIVDTTENNLKNLTRQLSDEEKAMKSQIQSYLLQSRKATTDGDFERAFNLASKAQLLADALIKK
jgi:hypothetical protein